MNVILIQLFSAIACLTIIICNVCVRVCVSEGIKFQVVYEANQVSTSIIVIICR